MCLFLVRSQVWVNGFGEDGTLLIDEDKRYALVDTLLLATVRAACRGAAAPAERCADVEAGLAARRARFPMQLWEDADRGRYPTVPATVALTAAGAAPPPADDGFVAGWSFLQSHA